MESAAPKKCRPARRSSRYAVPSLGGADYSGLHEARFVTLRAAVTAHDRSMAMRRRRRAGGKIRIGGNHGLLPPPPPRRDAAAASNGQSRSASMRFNVPRQIRRHGVAWRGVFRDQTRELVLFISLYYS